jgi:hypothetical protein
VQLDIVYAIAIDYYGNPVYRDPLGFSMLPVGGGQGGSGQAASEYYGTYYDYITFSDLIFLGITDVIESSSDLDPVITSVNPSFWQPGSTFSVVIDGTGFGAAPYLQIAPSDNLQWSVDSVNPSGTQILATVIVGSSADPGGRILSVISRGSTGLGFISGPGKSAKSNAHRVTIAGTTCDVSITNDGQSYPLNTNNYRQATIPLLATATSSCSGTVSWSLTFFYKTTGGMAAARWGPYTASGALNSSVNVTTDIGVGGRAEVIATVTISGISTTLAATLYVTGTVIPESIVTTKLRNMYAGATPALLTGIANKETRYATGGTFNGQFSRYRLKPKVGAVPLTPVDVEGYWPTEPEDGGSHIGLMQVVARPLAAWDWEENALEGAGVYQEALQWATNSYETGMRSACSNKLPYLDAIARENNALRFYRYGFKPSRAYWIRHPNCGSWIKNPWNDAEKYVEEVRSLMR